METAWGSSPLVVLELSRLKQKAYELDVSILLCSLICETLEVMSCHDVRIFPCVWMYTLLLPFRSRVTSYIFGKRNRGATCVDPLQIGLNALLTWDATVSCLGVHSRR